MHNHLFKTDHTLVGSRANSLASSGGLEVSLGAPLATCFPHTPVVKAHFFKRLNLFSPVIFQQWTADERGVGDGIVLDEWAAKHYRLSLSSSLERVVSKLIDHSAFTVSLISWISISLITCFRYSSSSSSAFLCSPVSRNPWIEMWDLRNRKWFDLALTVLGWKNPLSPIVCQCSHV